MRSMIKCRVSIIIVVAILFSTLGFAAQQPPVAEDVASRIKGWEAEIQKNEVEIKNEIQRLLKGGKVTGTHNSDIDRLKTEIEYNEKNIDKKKANELKVRVAKLDDQLRYIYLVNNIESRTTSTGGSSEGSAHAVDIFPLYLIISGGLLLIIASLLIYLDQRKSNTLLIEHQQFLQTNLSPITEMLSSIKKLESDLLALDNDIKRWLKIKEAGKSPEPSPIPPPDEIKSEEGITEANIIKAYNKYANEIDGSVNILRSGWQYTRLSVVNEDKFLKSYDKSPIVKEDDGGYLIAIHKNSNLHYVVPMPDTSLFVKTISHYFVIENFGHENGRSERLNKPAIFSRNGKKWDLDKKGSLVLR